MHLPSLKPLNFSSNFLHFQFSLFFLCSHIFLFLLSATFYHFRFFPFPFHPGIHSFFFHLIVVFFFTANFTYSLLLHDILNRIKNALLQMIFCLQPYTETTWSTRMRACIYNSGEELSFLSVFFLFFIFNSFLPCIWKTGEFHAVHVENIWKIKKRKRKTVFLIVFFILVNILKRRSSKTLWGRRHFWFQLSFLWMQSLVYKSNLLDTEITYRALQYRKENIPNIYQRHSWLSHFSNRHLCRWPNYLLMSLISLICSI